MTYFTYNCLLPFGSKDRFPISCFIDWLYCWLLQVMLCNPVCILGYTIASWRFFRERIEEEELSLIHFFAEEYVEYKKRVPTGLPFISGIPVN